MLKLFLLFCVYFVRNSYEIFTYPTRPYGHLNPYFNQTAFGNMSMINGSEIIFTIPSIWMQDDVNKRVRIDAGQIGQPGFQAEYYFFNNTSFAVTPDSSSETGFICTETPDFNYSMEVRTYGEPNLGYLGRHVLEEWDNQTADVYAGQAVDGVGQLNVLIYCDPTTCTNFLGMVVIGSANQFSYLEYWYGNNLSTAIPDPSYFYLPSECNNPKVEYYFQTHNADGSLKSTCNNTGSSHGAKASILIVICCMCLWLKL